MALEAVLYTAGWGHAELGKYEDFSGQSARDSVLTVQTGVGFSSTETQARSQEGGTVPIGKDPGLHAGLDLVRACSLDAVAGGHVQHGEPGSKRTRGATC